MERLTKRIGEHVYYTKLDYSKTIPSEYNPNDIGRILQALCAYEDTNHTPEECAAAFEELAAYRAAEQDGTLLRLPCKVGDTVYVLIPADCGFCDKEQCNNIFPCRMSYLVETEFSADIADDFGKTVFLTREAAKVVLKEQEGQK